MTKIEELTVSSGKKVSIEYTLKLVKGLGQSVFDTTVGSEPLTYIQGTHQIVSGLDKALEGMKIGENKSVIVKPEEGYGGVKPELFREFKKEDIPQKVLQAVTKKTIAGVGTWLRTREGEGQSIYPRGAEIKDKTVVLDFNHPLAGETLYFDIKVLDIQEAPDK